jgi:hypothetical protein
MQQWQTHNKMNKKENDDSQGVPVIKQLARPMSQEELETVAGGPGGCAPGTWNDHDDMAF